MHTPEFAVHLWMQIHMLDFPWVLCEQLLLLTWKLFDFTYLTIGFVWVICIPETRCAALDIFPLLNMITCIYYLEVWSRNSWFVLHTSWSWSVAMTNRPHKTKYSVLWGIYVKWGIAWDITARNLLKREQRKFRFYFSSACLCKFYTGISMWQNQNHLLFATTRQVWPVLTPSRRVQQYIPLLNVSSQDRLRKCQKNNITYSLQ